MHWQDSLRRSSKYSTSCLTPDDSMALCEWHLHAHISPDPTELCPSPPILPFVPGPAEGHEDAQLFICSSGPALNTVQPKGHQQMGSRLFLHIYIYICGSSKNNQIIVTLPNCKTGLKKSIRLWSNCTQIPGNCWKEQQISRWVMRWSLTSTFISQGRHVQPHPIPVDTAIATGHCDTQTPWHTDTVTGKRERCLCPTRCPHHLIAAVLTRFTSRSWQSEALSLRGLWQWALHAALSH